MVHKLGTRRSWSPEKEAGRGPLLQGRDGGVGSPLPSSRLPLPSSRPPLPQTGPLQMLGGSPRFSWAPARGLLTPSPQLLGSPPVSAATRDHRLGGLKPQKLLLPDSGAASPRPNCHQDGLPRGPGRLHLPSQLLGLRALHGVWPQHPACLRRPVTGTGCLCPLLS